MATQIPEAPQVPALGSSTFEDDMRNFHTWEKEQLQPNINLIATEVENNRNDTETFKNEALQYRNDAETFKNKAEQWAENAENVEVEPGLYSAKHYSIKSNEYANLSEQYKNDAYNILVNGGYKGIWDDTDPNKIAQKGEIWKYNDKFWISTTDNNTDDPSITSANWELWDNVKNFIDDNVISSEKTYSSNKIHNELNLKANSDLTNVDDLNILNKIKNVDGDGSGLDADTLDGKHYSDIETNLKVPVGTIIAFASDTPPNGFLECNGAEISRTDYNDLFNVIGTTFGAGNGSTTFNLPDLRGEFIRGWDNGRGVDNGRTFGSWQADDLKEHNHHMNAYPNYGGGATTVTCTGSSGYTVYTSSIGGSETRPRNIALMFCIKY